MNLQQLNKRYSVKKFDSQRKLAVEQVELLKQAFYLCPSSLNIQAWKLIVVSDDSLKEQLVAAGRDTNGKRIKECSHLFIFAQKKVTFKHIEKVVKTTEMLQLTIKKMGLTERKFILFIWLYKLFAGRTRWVTSQVYINLGFLLATCASAGIGSLPMEGINKKKVDSILKLGPNYKTVVALAVGYPHPDDSTNPSLLKKSRLPYDEIVEEK